MQLTLWVRSERQLEIRYSLDIQVIHAAPDESVASLPALHLDFSSDPHCDELLRNEISKYLPSYRSCLGGRLGVVLWIPCHNDSAVSGECHLRPVRLDSPSLGESPHEGRFERP